MKKYKVDYRVYAREPLLSSSTDCVFTAVRFFDDPVKFAVEVADFGPDAADDIVRDFIESNPKFAGRTLWVQQNAYRLEGTHFENYYRIMFTAFRVDAFPSE